MSDFEIRTLAESENRAAAALFRAAVHTPAPNDEDWERAQHAFQPGRALGAFDGDAIVGLAKSVDSELTLPGGKQLPMGAVTSIAVRSDRTRRGVASSLIGAQLNEFVDRGLTLAGLRASEAVIYGRFGYGVATQVRDYALDRRRAQLRVPPADGGRIELHELDEAIRLMPELYARFPASRPGMMTRPSYLWPSWHSFFRKGNGLMRLAVYHGVDGPDGYAAYRVHDPWPDSGDSALYVEDMNAASPRAFAELWRYLTSVDLVDVIHARGRPVDDPIEPMLVDSRGCAVRHIGDDLWVRLLDVPAALSARTFDGQGAVVIEVRDSLLTSNNGRYRVSADGVERTTDPAALSLDVEVLGMLYLGGWRVANLVQAGRIAVADAAAVPVAQRLFASERVPWCGTWF